MILLFKHIKTHRKIKRQRIQTHKDKTINTVANMFADACCVCKDKNI